MAYMKNKKGVALIVVAVLIVVAIPMTFMFLNMGSSQKNQALNFEKVMRLEQISLSGINDGISRLKYKNYIGYFNLNAQISGSDRYDLNLSPTGIGFFGQNIYLFSSKAKDTATRDGVAKHSSIILADAEQFKSSGSSGNNVITHDFWDTIEPYELGDVADVLSMRNARGQQQIRFLDVKKYEMQSTDSDYERDMRALLAMLPNEFDTSRDEIVSVLSSQKLTENR